MRNFFLFHRQSVTDCERRLCRDNSAEEHLGTGPESLHKAQEVLESFALLERNAAIKKAMALYDDPLVRARFPELVSKSLDRPYVLTLLLDGMVRDKDGKPIEKGKFGFTDIPGYTADPVDPFGIYEKYKNDMPGLGAFLKKVITEKDNQVLLQIANEGRRAQDAVLGNKYKDVIENARIAQTRPYPNTVFVDVNLLWYRHIREELQGSMKKKGVAMPDLTKDFVATRLTEHANQLKPETPPKSKLTKVEYLALLRKGIREKELEPSKKFEVAKDILKAGGDEAEALPRNTGNLFTTMTVGKYGPQESLRRLGIDVGDGALRKYLDKRSGIVRDEKDGKVIPGAKIKELIGSAKEWQEDPKAAFEFLFGDKDGAMTTTDVAGTSYRVFRDSLEHWFVRDNQGPLPRVDEPPHMSKEDTKAVLYLVIQQFLVYEDPMKKTNDQREELKKEVTLTQNLEGFMGKSWEYMKDFEKHPVGSALMWLTAFHAGRILLGTLKGKTTLLKLGLIGGAAIGLYQQNSKGRAWWNDLIDSATGAITKDQALNPKDRTLPNYWLRELKKVEGEPGEYDNLTEDKAQLMLALSGTVPIQDMLGWYQKYQAFTLHRDGNTMPPIPFKYSKFRNRLGADAGPKQVGDYLYKTLHKFFVNRGEAVQQEHIPFEIPGGFSEKEGLGFAYIKDKYIEHRYYLRLIENLGIPKDLKLTEPEIKKLKNGVKLTGEEIAANPKLQAEMVRLEGIAQPDRDRHISALLYLIRLFDQEKIDDHSSIYPMDHVYFMESNPEVLSRMQSEGALPAGAWEQFLSFFRKGNKPVVGVAAASYVRDPAASYVERAAAGGLTRDSAGGAADRSTDSTKEKATGSVEGGVAGGAADRPAADTSRDTAGGATEKSHGDTKMGGAAGATSDLPASVESDGAGPPAERILPGGRGE